MARFLTRRLRRSLFASPKLWRRRAVFWLGALAVGLVSVGFAMLADFGQHAFLRAESRLWWLTLLVTPLGFGVIAALASTTFQGTQGSGIPQAIAARHHRTSAERRRLLSPRIVLGKIVLTVAGLMCGASVGREGPTVQIGAGLMWQTARRGGMPHERGLILAGSAAGIAAAFNTPLAGIVFAIEEMSRSFEQRTNGLVLYAVILSGLVSLAMLGDYSYFGITDAEVSGPIGWFAVILCGSAGGLFGGVFSRGLLELTRLFRRHTAGRRIAHRAAIAAACGLVVAVTGILTSGTTFGTGYEQARQAVEGVPIAASFWIGKFVATLATAVSGIPGGIFAPSLAVGAGFGSWIGQMLGIHALGPIAIMGMCGYFAGVVQAPMTAFVIILEMTGGSGNVLPLMVAAVTGLGASKIVAPHPLYHGLARVFMEPRPAAGAKGPAAPKPPAPPAPPAVTSAP